VSTTAATDRFGGFLREDLLRVYREARTIAVVGASDNPEKPAHGIPAYLQSRGYRIIPVNPRGGEIFGESAVGSLAEGVRPAETDTDVVAPAQAWGQAKDLFVAAAVAVQEYQQRIRVVGFIAGGQERAKRPAGRRLHLRSIKPFTGTKQTSGEIGARHGESDYSENRSSVKRKGFAAAKTGRCACRRGFQSSRLAKSTIGPLGCQRRP